MSGLTFLLFLSQGMCQQHGLHLITIQNFNESSDIAALVKNYQQKENIWVRLEKPNQVLLNYLSGKGDTHTYTHTPQWYQGPARQPRHTSFWFLCFHKISQIQEIGKLLTKFHIYFKLMDSQFVESELLNLAV